MNNIFNLIDNLPEEKAKKICIEYKSKKDDWKKYTYLDLSKESNELANYLIEKQKEFINKNIAIISESRPEWIISFFASIKAGFTVIPIDVKLTEKEIQVILENCKPSLIFVSPDCNKKLNQQWNLINIEALPKAEIENNFTARHDSETALIVYTSGTTGEPKGIEITFKNLCFQINATSDFAKFENNDVFLSVLPLNHLFEFTCGFLTVLRHGGKICYGSKVTPKDLIKNLQEKQVTYMIVVPQLLKILKLSIEKNIRESDDYVQYIFNFLYKISKYLPLSMRRLLFGFIRKKFAENLKASVAGGAALSVDIADFFDRLGIPVYQGYGLSETSPVISFNTHIFNKYGSVGKAINNIEIKIINDEICVRGDNLMKGYYNDLEKTKEVIDSEGWFHTGDIGYFDEDKFLYITGRSKNLIVLANGKKVHPEELENIFSEIKIFKEFCILGTTDPRAPLSDEVCLVAVLHEKLSETELKAYLQDYYKNIAQYKIPTRIVIRETPLPRTTTMKVKRNILKREI